MTAAAPLVPRRDMARDATARRTVRAGTNAAIFRYEVARRRGRPSQGPVGAGRHQGASRPRIHSTWGIGKRRGACARAIFSALRDTLPRLRSPARRVRTVAYRHPPAITAMSTAAAVGHDGGLSRIRLMMTRMDVGGGIGAETAPATRFAALEKTPKYRPDTP